MREIAVVSGKGGTGKTSLTACFAVLGDAVVADCDVDAADLHLILDPSVRRTVPFEGGSCASVQVGRCMGCGRCIVVCRFGAARAVPGEDGSVAAVDPMACEGCGVCGRICPVDAIELHRAQQGEWYVSDTRAGPMVHAALRVGGENSGQLVTQVRNEAARLAASAGRDLVLVDGPPGVGCPVIATVTGVDAVLIVTEPSVSSQHDMTRVTRLLDHFGIPGWVCVNRCDINVETSGRIRETAAALGLRWAGEIGYDRAFTDAQIAGKALVEVANTHTTQQIHSVWETVHGSDL